MEFSIEIIKESDFRPLANNAARGLLDFSAYFSKNPDTKLSKKNHAAFIKESIELEDFLDDHGARSNKLWVYFGELVASIRSFASTAYMINHILSRIKFYNISNIDFDGFITDSEKNLTFLNDSIFLLFNCISEEALKLGLDIPEPNFRDDAFEDRLVVQILPNTINQEAVTDIHEYVSGVASELVDAVKVSQVVLIEKKLPQRNLAGTIIPDRINEETLRHIEMHVHNAQSMYDTYIQKTPLESESPKLKSLRGHISISLHLLGIARELSHFFERHEISVRKEATRKKIAKIIKQKYVIETIINYALYYYTIFITQGEKIANEIIEKFTVLESVRVKTPEGLGFHLRPSTLVAKIANHYGGKVLMRLDTREFDASSVIDIMWAGGIIKKEGIQTILFEGDKNAIKDLVILSESNYGEDAMGNSIDLPESLAYLRQE